MSDHKRRFGLGKLLLCVLCAAIAPASNAGPYSEDAIMAAYLIRFIGYVEWPEESASKAPFTIAVLGANGVAEELSQLLAAPANKHRQIRMQRINAVAEIGNAQVVFIGAENAERLKKLIAAIAGKPVLVVTDDAHGIDMGSTINFVRVEQRIRFEASLIAAKKNSLTISSELLAVALRVVLATLDSKVPCASADTSKLCPQLDVRL
jgi:hypothetical protein